MKRKQKFLHDLRKNLEDKNYKERFLQEIEEHIDDDIYQKTFAGLSPEEAEKKTLLQMGTPRQIAHYFDTIMNKNSGVYGYYLEIVLLSLFSLPLYVYTFMLANLMWISVPIEGKILIFLAHIVLGALFFIFYSFAFAKVRFLIQDKTSFLIISLLLFSIPIFVYVFYIYHYVSSLAFNNLQDLGLPVLLFVYLAAGIGMAFLTYVKNKKGIFYMAKRNQNNDKIFSFWKVALIFLIPFFLLRFVVPYFYVSLPLLIGGIFFFFRYQKKILPALQSKKIKTFLSVCLTTYVIFSNVMIWLGYTNITEISSEFLRNFMSIRVAFDALAVIILSILFGLDGILMIWISGIFSLLFVGKLIFNMILQKKFSLISIAIILYLVPILFINSFKEPVLNWKVPVFNIGQTIEMQQFGPFYHFAKYVNQSDSQVFKYFIDSDQDKFVIYQSGGNHNYLKKMFIFDYPKDFSTLFLKENSPELKNIDFHFMTETLPSNVKCVRLDHEDYKKIPAPSAQFYQNNPVPYCKKLYYKDQLIWEQAADNLYPIYNASVSKDGKWMLLEIGRGFYDPENVYLVQLN